jgi:hypothetical protein
MDEGSLYYWRLVEKHLVRLAGTLTGSPVTGR